MLMHYQSETAGGARGPNDYARGLCGFGAVLLDSPLDLSKVNEVQLRAWASQSRGRGDMRTLAKIDAELSRRSNN